MWIRLKDGVAPIPVALMHEIKNGLAKSKLAMEKQGWKNDKVALQLNELLGEIVNLEMGAFFTKFIQVEGFKAGLWTGVRLGFIGGVLVSLVCYFVAVNW